MDMEKMFYDYAEADLWIALNVDSKTQLLDMDSRYDHFKAVKSGALYGLNGKVSKNGVSLYWETAHLLCDKLLMDFIHLFHDEDPTDFYFFNRLEN